MKNWSNQSDRVCSASPFQNIFYGIHRGRHPYNRLFSSKVMQFVIRNGYPFFHFFWAKLTEFNILFYNFTSTEIYQVPVVCTETEIGNVKLQLILSIIFCFKYLKAVINCVILRASRCETIFNEYLFRKSEWKVKYKNSNKKWKIVYAF